MGLFRRDEQDSCQFPAVYRTPSNMSWPGSAGWDSLAPGRELERNLIRARRAKEPFAHTLYYSRECACGVVMGGTLGRGASCRMNRQGCAVHARRSVGREASRPISWKPPCRLPSPRRPIARGLRRASWRSSPAEPARWTRRLHSSAPRAHPPHRPETSQGLCRGRQ